MTRRLLVSITRFAGLSTPRKLIYAEISMRFIGAWILVRCVPYTWWKRLLRQSARVKRLEAATPEDISFLTDLQHAFRQVKWATRDRATCLMLVLVARWTLNKRRIPGTVFFGVRRSPEKLGLFAHAWMMSAIGVVGHEEVDDFTIVERFAD